MASATYMEDLSCSICLAIFTDPVGLLCGHSFCRECVTRFLSTQDQCPQCRRTVPTEEKYLPTNHILKSLAEKAKLEMIKKEQGNKEIGVAECMCPEHEEKLKLFCETDQQLACVICRDGERHDGHKFKPIKEAATSLRRELKKGIDNLSGDIGAIESLVNTQTEEMKKVQETSCQLMNQITTQFEEMYRFLRKREEEIKNELREKETETVEKMTEMINAMDLALTESRETEVRARSALEIEDSARFLQSWTDGKTATAPESLFRSRASVLLVVSTPLSLGPYESHMQFFVWKEMLQVIKPLPEFLSLRKDNRDITVSDDGRSLYCTPQSSRSHSGISDPVGPVYSKHRRYAFMPPVVRQAETTLSFNEFTSGQHYWEIEVGKRDFWELGVKGNSLKYEGQKYVICNPYLKELTYEGRPRKIGIYLNCLSKELSFYNADNMEHLHTIRSRSMSMPQSAYFNIGFGKDPDPNPMTVCWY
ncbi:tripartite motif containing 108 [Polymixia lowei]